MKKAKLLFSLSFFFFVQEIITLNISISFYLYLLISNGNESEDYLFFIGNLIFIILKYIFNFRTVTKILSEGLVRYI